MNVAVHPPTHPQQQKTTGEHKADNAHQPTNTERKNDPQQQCCDDADQDDLFALDCGKPRRERTDNNRIVARQCDINQQNLQKC